MVLKPLFLAAALVASSNAWTVFTVPHTSGQDDTPGLIQTLSAGNVTTNATILFQKSITYNIFTPIKFPVMHNVEVAIEGNLTYPTDISTIQGKSSYEEYFYHELIGGLIQLRSLPLCVLLLFSSALNNTSLTALQSYPGAW